jgi:hypothetical protein
MDAPLRHSSVHANHHRDFPPTSTLQGISEDELLPATAPRPRFQNGPGGRAYPYHVAGQRESFPSLLPGHPLHPGVKRPGSTAEANARRAARGGPLRLLLSAGGYQG